MLFSRFREQGNAKEPVQGLVDRAGRQEAILVPIWPGSVRRRFITSRQANRRARLRNLGETHDSVFDAQGPMPHEESALNQETVIVLRPRKIGKLVLTFVEVSRQSAEKSLSG
jgi:hypothetical protein